MAEIEVWLAEVRAVLARNAPARLPLFEVFAREALFARHWLAPQLASLAPGAAVLEVGAGLMLVSCQLQREGYRVTALEPVGTGFSAFRDLQARVLEVAERAGNVPRILTTPVESLSSVGDFDLAFSVNVMEHVADVRLALQRIAASLREGAAYCFTCPNYLFPYEPHFNIPILGGKRWTHRAFRRRIEFVERATDGAGLWHSLNWITVPVVRRACRDLPHVRLAFDTRLLSRVLERVVSDPVFAARRPSWLRSLAGLLVSTRLHEGFRLLPAAVQPLIDCRLTRERQDSGVPRTGRR